MSISSIKPWQWGLYDFANSLANVAMSFYFALWFVEDFGGGDAGISIVVALVTLLLLGSLPQIGARADRTGQHARFLTMFTVGIVATLTVLGFVSLSLQNTSPLLMVLILGLYGLFQYLYQSSVSIYTSLIRYVGQDGKDDEVRVSGIGNAMGQLGNVVGIFIALPIAEAFSRPAAFLSGALFFLLFSLPALFWIRRLRTAPSTPLAPITFLATWKEVRSSPDIFNYLIGYYLFADAVLTLQLFMSLYLTVVAHLSDSLKAGLMAGALLFGVFGALLSKKITNRIPVKRAIELCILSWAALLTLFALVSNPILFLIVTLLNGFAFGVLFSLSQGYYSTLVPKNEQARYFGIYTIFERASSLLGPLLWSFILILFTTWGEWRYRFAVLSLAFLILLSLVFMRKVKGPRTF